MRGGSVQVQTEHANTVMVAKTRRYLTLVHILRNIYKEDGKLDKLQMTIVQFLLQLHPKKIETNRNFFKKKVSYVVYLTCFYLFFGTLMPNESWSLTYIQQSIVAINPKLGSTCKTYKITAIT